MPTTGASANAIEFSFDNPKAMPAEADLQAAVASLDTTPAAGSATASPKATATLAVTTADGTRHEASLDDALGTPAAAAATEATAAPVPEAAPSADAKTYTIKVDGRDLIVTERDLLDGHMRHRDYTQKTQRIAEQTREWQEKEAQFNAQLQALDTFLRDKSALDAYYTKAFGTASAAQTAAPQVDPNTPMTPQQVAEIARYNADQVRQYADRLVEQRMQEAESRTIARVQHTQQAAKAETDINGHMASLLDKYPLLRKVEDIEDILIADAAKHVVPGRTSVEDAKGLLAQAAERRSSIFKAIADDDKKQAAVAAARLKTTATEPPGGSAVKAKPGKRSSLNTSDRGALLQAATEDLQAFLDANAA